MRVSSILFSALLSLLAWFGADSADAASPAVRMGQAAPASAELGSCLCTLAQVGDTHLTNASYEVPSDGVITRSGLTVGAETQLTDWAQVRIVKPNGSTATVVSEGAEHSLFGLTPHVVSRFYDRVPASAHDVLGLRVHNSTAYVGFTTDRFETAESADEVAFASGNPALGSPFSFSIGTKLRLNLEAILEPDADHDGYGDVSQDLCPGSPIGGSACSGSLFGSDFEGNHSGSGGSGFDSMYVQKTLHGASTAQAANGVIVRWRVLGAPTASYQLRVLGPSGSEYKVLRSSAVENVTAEASPPIGPITSFATRLPIPAGGYVALATPTSVPERILTTSGSSLSKVNNAGDGAVVPSLPDNIPNAELAYDADIEPDVDGDGYGDITQDACPTDASTQGACSAPTPGPAPGSGPEPSGAVPAITAFRVVPSRFRVDPHGAVISAGAHLGAKVKLTLSAVASVAFAVEGHHTCGRAHAPGRCKPWATLARFKRSLGAGPSSLPFSGRYRKQGKVKPLSPGSYRLTALPTDAAGRRGAVAHTAFTVLR